MKKKLLSLFVGAFLVLVPAASASASSYNGTTVAPAADGKTYTVSAGAGDTLTLTNLPAPAGQLAITFNSTVSGTIVITPSTTLPASAPTAPKGTVNIYYDVVLNGLTNANITSGTWSFNTPKSWLNQLGLAPTNVVLYHYENGAWKALTTRQGTATATDYTFAADTTSFSPFAIVAAPGLSNTGASYVVTALVATGVLAAVVLVYVATRKQKALNVK
jgi:PGF-pre-PGF domain-containing protein